MIHGHIVLVSSPSRESAEKAVDAWKESEKLLAEGIPPKATSDGSMSDMKFHYQRFIANSEAEMESLIDVFVKQHAASNPNTLLCKKRIFI